MSTIIHFLCRGLFYKNVGILLGDCLICEELSGGYSQEMM